MNGIFFERPTVCLSSNNAPRPREEFSLELRSTEEIFPMNTVDKIVSSLSSKDEIPFTSIVLWQENQPFTSN